MQVFHYNFGNFLTLCIPAENQVLGASWNQKLLVNRDRFTNQMFCCCFLAALFLKLSNSLCIFVDLSFNFLHTAFFFVLPCARNLSGAKLDNCSTGSYLLLIILIHCRVLFNGNFSPCAHFIDISCLFCNIIFIWYSSNVRYDSCILFMRVEWN